MKNVICLSSVIVLFVTGCQSKWFGHRTPVAVEKTESPSQVQAHVSAPVVKPPESFAGPPMQSGLKLPNIFGNNMVLQQGMSVPVWGWANDGESVTVSFRGQKLSTIAENGKWQIRLRNLRPGVPDTLTVSGLKTIEFTNVVVGEVWLASGQSNMEWPLSKAFQPEADIASATNSEIRLFVVPNVKADSPQTNIQARWELCSPETAKNVSAVAYYFARDLQQARQTSVGIIESDWGGSPAEAWTSIDVLEINPRYRAEIIDPYPAAEKTYQESLATWEKEKAEAEKKKQEFKKWAPWKPWKPSELFNGMIAPIAPYAIKGVIWYQGESNASRAHQYRSLFPDMIRNWRRVWGQGDFPFIAVQLAPFKVIQAQPGESDWAELREAQLIATKVLPKVGMVVITDVGEQHDIHPTRKGPVGSRLALAARGIAYGEHVTYSGPIYKSVRFKEGKAIVSFDNVGSGLEARGGALKGFAVCGPDKKFYWALAQIQSDNSVLVWSPNVEMPIAVRFGWADFPVANLWNREGLPASPFRTDNFPMLTEPKGQAVAKSATP